MIKKKKKKRKKHSYGFLACCLLTYTAFWGQEQDICVSLWTPHLGPRVWMKGRINDEQCDSVMLLERSLSLSLANDSCPNPYVILTLTELHSQQGLFHTDMDLGWTEVTPRTTAPREKGNKGERSFLTSSLWLLPPPRRINEWWTKKQQTGVAKWAAACRSWSNTSGKHPNGCCTPSAGASAPGLGKVRSTGWGQKTLPWGYVH